VSARIIRVIVTELEVRGRGTKDDPRRRVRQYWSLDGKLLAEVDPWSNNVSPFTEPPPPSLIRE
jgi:hypothetical protein